MVAQIQKRLKRLSIHARTPIMDIWGVVALESGLGFSFEGRDLRAVISRVDTWSFDQVGGTFLSL